MPKPEEAPRQEGVDVAGEGNLTRYMSSLCEPASMYRENSPSPADGFQAICQQRQLHHNEDLPPLSRSTTCPALPMATCVVEGQGGDPSLSNAKFQGSPRAEVRKVTFMTDLPPPVPGALPRAVEKHGAIWPPRKRRTDQSKVAEPSKEDSPTTAKAYLLDHPQLAVTPVALTTAWVAHVLQQHQDATQEYIERKLSDLQNSLEHTIISGTMTSGNASASVCFPEEANQTGSPYVPLAGKGCPSAWQSRCPIDAAKIGEPEITSTRESVLSGANEVDKKTSAKSKASAGSAQHGRLKRQKTKSAIHTLTLDVPETPMAKQGSSTSVGTTLREPPSTGSPASKIWPNNKFANDNHPFVVNCLYILNIVGVFMVSMNSVFIFLELESQGSKIASNLDISPDISGWGVLDDTFTVADHVFNVFYIAEMIAKISLMRSDYIKDPLNILDAMVAVLNMIDILILKGSGSIVLARFARLIRVSRLARLPRIARVSHELCALINTLYLSLRALACAAVLLVLIVSISGLAMSHFVGLYLLEECEPNDPICIWSYTHYGSASRATWTMFQITLSGSWPVLARPTVESMSWFYVLFWLMYIIIVWFGVLRVLTALFLKQTMEVAQCDHETLIKDKMREKARYAAALREFFLDVDKDGDGSINHTEFHNALSDPKAKAWLNTLDLEVVEVDTLFQMLDDGDGYISFDELLASAVRLRGWARASDLITMACNQKTMLTRLDQLSNEVDGFMKGITQTLSLPAAAENFRGFVPPRDCSMP